MYVCMYCGIDLIPRWVLQGQSIPTLAQGPSHLIRACVDWEGESSHGEAISAAAVLGIVRHTGYRPLRKKRIRFEAADQVIPSV